MLGSIGMIPVATALAGPAESAFGRIYALWGCSALVVLLTAAVLTVPDVRHLTRRTTTPEARKQQVTEAPSVSADAEGAVGRTG